MRTPARVTSIDALSDLTLCARLVGDLLGTESQCFQAAALMIATARELGHELEPRLVSALGVSNGRSP